MAIKFSANALIRESVGKFLADRSSSLDQAQIATVSACLKELEEMSVGETVIDPGERLVGPQVDLRVDVLFYERSMDPVRAGQLYLEIHRQIAHAFVPIEMYYRMPDAFKELNIPCPDSELQIAVETSVNQIQKNLSHSGPFSEPRRYEFVPRRAIEAHHRNHREGS